MAAGLACRWPSLAALTAAPHFEAEALSDQPTLGTQPIHRVAGVSLSPTSTGQWTPQPVECSGSSRNGAFRPCK